MTLERSGRIANDIEQGLYHLVAIEIDFGQARVVIAVDVEPPLVFGLDEPDDILEQLVNVDRLLVGRTARAEQRIHEGGQAIRFADHDVGVFAQLRLAELPLEQLCRAADTAQRVLDLVGKLPDHLPPRAVLDEQRILAAYLRAARHVGDFDEQGRVVDIDGRNPAVDDALVRVDLGRREPHLVGEVVARRRDARKNLAHFRFVVHESQQRFSPCARATDAEDVLRRRVQVDDEQVVVQQDDPGAEIIEDPAGIAAERSVAGAAASQRTVFCWT